MWKDFLPKLHMVQPIKHARSQKTKMETLNIWVCVVYNCFCRHIPFVYESTFIGFQIFFSEMEKKGEDGEGTSHSSCNSLTCISGENKHAFLAITESIHPLCHLEDEILFLYSCHCQHHH